MNATMNNRPSVKLMSLAAVTTIAVLQAASANAIPAEGVPLLSERAAAALAHTPALAKAKSAVIGKFNAAALRAPVLDITLADGTVARAKLQRVARDGSKLTESWVGTFEDSPGGILVISKVKGVITGFANYKEHTLEFVPVAGGKHLFYAVDNARLPQKEVVRRPKLAADTTGTASDYGTGGVTTASADAIVQDVMVLYTANSAARYGQASIESQIQSAIEAANQAYQASLANITLNLVAVQQTALTEQSSMDATYNVLQTDTTVAKLRDSVKADMVMLVAENSEYCGTANLMTSNSTSFAPHAYGIVFSGCISNQSIAHEFGHQQGLMHDRESSTGWVGVLPYSYGYRRCVSDGTGFRDIMSYACSGAPRVLLFSNPNVTYNGYTAGIAYETSASTSADNARSLNATAATVAAFRSSTTTIQSSLPAAPGNLTIKGAAYNQVAVAWSDNAMNEAGYKLERSTDGVNFGEIATLGTGAVAFADASVSARTTYYYRVRAFNSSGVSAYSATTSVTTPDAPIGTTPAAPDSMSVKSAQTTQVGLAWTDRSTNETGFRLERSLDGATFDEIAVLSAGSVSYTDSTVSGGKMFYYRVRAYNGAGNSTYSNTVKALTPTTTTMVAPTAPSGVSAVGVVGAANVSWSATGTNATTFEVRREKWDARSGNWKGRTTAATVPASITSIVDIVSKGRYRYSVRASNSKGSSGWAGPAEATAQ